MSRNDLKKPLKGKPKKLARFEKFNMPRKRKFGKSLSGCRNCGKTRGVIRKYSLLYCRQCFREQAEKLGFKKYS